jgi:hypothetical protein
MEEKLRLLEEEKQEIARDMQELERIVAKYDLLVVATPSVPVPPLKNTSRTNLARAAKEAESIIRVTGHPLGTHELLTTIVVDREIEISGRGEPTNNLAAAMILSKKLVHIKDVGWWIKGVPWPATAEDIAKLRAEPVDSSPVEKPPDGRVNFRRTAEKQRLFEAIRTLLRGRTEPMKFGELFERVKEAGVEIGGTDERQNLAVFLSKFSCFSTEGRRYGWRYLPERDFEQVQVLSLRKHKIEDLNAEEARLEHAQLTAEIKQHDEGYYQKDAPTVSDAEYDDLRKRRDAIAKRFWLPPVN